MKKILQWYQGLSIYLKLLPFLLLYIIVCLFFPQPDSFGDEGRYLMFSNNLLHGFYSPPPPAINLWNGPGYPIFLAPFIFLKIPLAGLRLANAFLLYFSLIISYKTFNFYSSKKNSFLFTIALACYFPILEYVRTIVTETITWFLITAIIYVFVKIFKEKKNSWKLLLLCSFLIAYLVMTKIIFGYVIIIMLLLSVAMYVLPRFRLSAKKSTIIFFISFIFCLPWLIYTYSLTNKTFYWGNSGSMSLYTMSTPYSDETGDWYDEHMLQKKPNHAAFIDSVLKLNPLQRDEALKSAAVKNIKGHPKKYAANIASNIGRLLFFPSIYSPNSLAAYLPFLCNLFVVPLFIITAFISLYYHKKIPHEIVFLFLFIFIYLAGTVFLSAYRRMFFVVIPFVFFFISYFFNNVIVVKARPNIKTE